MTEDDEEGAELKKYEEAGRIARDAVERSRPLIVVGAKLFDVAETVEGWINEKAACAFPVNISVNENASHYTPSLNEDTVFGEKDVVNVDIGVHVDGLIGDVAYSVDLSGENGKLVEASEEALKAGLATVRHGAETTKIGKAIEEVIKRYGFKPVENLTGHGLQPYEVHAEPTIPNVETAHGTTLEEGEIVALEPFASTGDGYVRQGKRTDIFSFSRERPMRNMLARQVMQRAKDSYETLPFAERWLARSYDAFGLTIALRELVKNEVFTAYPVLRDKTGSLVSQAEVTVVVEKGGCRILT